MSVQKPTEAGRYLDAFGNTWRLWNDGQFAMLGNSDADPERYGPWKKLVVAEEPEWEYGVGWRYDERLIAFSTHTRAAAEKYIGLHPEDLDFGSHVLVQREPEQPAGPWVPVKQEGAEE